MPEHKPTENQPETGLSSKEKDLSDSSESQFATQETPGRALADVPEAFPEHMGHYEIQAVLGYGGMGQVFKAFDPALRRYVALKLLRAETPELAARFAQEARVQAKIEHENVCKVFEVGEADGRQFIAMQFIPGKTLGAAADEIKLEEKLRIIKQVAEALHAAHKEELIHRDIKPSNIMVVHDEGRWRPYIMDFGLAREQESASLTITGLVMGTPHFMAPEQARGETNRLDRRTDVYSLGATIYRILSGKTPFSGESSADVLLKVLQDDPPSLRKIDPSIPHDVETIVMKCLEKEPHRRYESAKALAEDLQRYLDGDPIAARPVRWSERLVKKARKNKVATGILGAAVLVTLILLGSLIWVQTRSSVQAKYARQFGEEIRGIESMIRSSYSAPLHDIRPELGIARNRLAKMETRIDEVGRWAYGPGHNALGLGYFALDDYEKALQNLKIAWDSDYRESSTTYALGKTFGVLYQRALGDAEGIKNKVLREEQIAKIEKELRDPAVYYLKMSRSSSESPVYVDGLIAFYEKRYSEALRNSIEAYKQAGWSFDAKKLEGDLYLAAGKESGDKGEDQKAVKNYDSAGAAYRTAIELGRSRAEIYLSEADRWTSILNRDSQKGNSNEAALKSALSFADQAIAINADAPEGYYRKLKAYTTYGNYLMYNTGDDPRPMMEKGIAMAREVTKRDPADLRAYDETAVAYRLTGEYEIRHGMDPRKALNLAIQNNEKSLKAKPGNPRALSGNGICYSILGEYEWKHGMDPRPTFRKALQQYRTSQKLNPKYTQAFVNGGIASWYIASYEAGKGIDPRPSFQEAIDQDEHAIHQNPNDSFALFNLSLVYVDAGNHEMLVGRDPSVRLKQSLDALQKSAKIMTNAYVPSGLCTVYSYLGAYQIERGQDPTSNLDQARAACKKSMEIDPSYYEPVGFLGRAETYAARWAMRAGKPADKYFQEAHKNFQRAIQLNPEEASIYQLSAESWRWDAEWMQQQKRPAAKSIAEGFQMVDKALMFDAESADALAVQGALYLLKSSEEKNSSDSIRKAKSSLERALKINRWLEREYGPLLKKASVP